MSVFHRITDIESMPGPKFLRLARRITCYQGVMAARLAEELAVQRAGAGQQALPHGTDIQSDQTAVPVHAGGGKDLVQMVHRALSNRR